LGFVIGPALGAMAYRITGDPMSPVHLAAVVTLAVTLWGFFVMPESLQPENRAQIKLAEMNPFTQLSSVLQMREIRLLLATSFLWALAYAFMQGNLSYLTEERLNWSPDETSLLFFIAGISMIVSQGKLVKRLLPLLAETRMALVGLGLVVISYLMIVYVTITGESTLMYVMAAVAGLGIGLVNPALSGLLSNAVSAHEQGRVQGGNQALGALSRVVGPIWAGWTYGQFTSGAPYISGIVAMALAGVLLLASAPVSAHTKQVESIAAR
jgi:DHA1 family tetracycline resistance protein-like MFS transporter